MRSILTGVIRLVVSVIVLIIAILSYTYFVMEVKNLQVNPKLYSNIDTLENTLPKFAPQQEFALGQLPAIARLEQDGRFRCTVFVVSNDYAITAAHCLVTPYKKLITAEFQIVSEGREETVTAEAVGVYNSGDLGLLKGAFNNFKKISIIADYSAANAAPAILQSPVRAACGYPRGIKQAVCYPQVSCSPYYDGIACQGLLYNGMSGGPLLVLDMSTMTAIAAGVNSAMGPDSTIFYPLIGLFELLNIKQE